MRETQWTDVTDARCPANQHTHNESLITNLQDKSINTSVQLSSSRAVHKTDPSCSLVRLLKSLDTTVLSSTILSTTSAEVRSASQGNTTPIIVVATILPRYVQRPTHQTTVPRELTEALANKTRLHWAQEGPPRGRGGRRAALHFCWGTIVRHLQHWVPPDVASSICWLQQLGSSDPQPRTLRCWVA